MRLLKVLSTIAIAAVALLAGLFTAMLVAVGGALIYLFRRLLGSSKSSPARGESVPHSRVSQMDADVIDVTATEVPADPAAR